MAPAYTVHARKHNGAMPDAPLFDGPALQRLADENPTQPCPACAALTAPGWESIPGGYDSSHLRKAGTLRSPEVEDPTLEEYHPAGTHAWSADAPIAPAFFPYNRCDVWQCAQCGRPFLRYTEYGGYYVEERIRPLRAGLVVAS
jgi:hypothetical protein